jgi:hypothetical protein
MYERFNKDEAYYRFGMYYKKTAEEFPPGNESERFEGFKASLLGMQ